MIDALGEDDIPKKEIIEFIYSNQCTSNTSSEEKSSADTNFGFFGGPYLGFDSYQPEEDAIDKQNPYYTGNLVYTFPALCCLIMLGDDLSRVNKSAIIKGLKLLQEENGW